jgi:hypothetical protein
MVDRAALHAPFRGRRGRAVAWIAAAVVSAVLLGVAAAIRDQLSWYDWLGFAAVALAVTWLLSRLAGVAAFPSEAGLVVRNVLITTELEWAQIVAVRFGGGDPWVLLDLSDGDTLAVMAVQRADGEWGRAEANRLATLVELHALH